MRTHTKFIGHLSKNVNYFEKTKNFFRILAIIPQCLKLVSSKNCTNLFEIFLLSLFYMGANQTEYSKLEQRSIIKFLVKTM